MDLETSLGEGWLKKKGQQYHREGYVDPVFLFNGDLDEMASTAALTLVGGSPMIGFAAGAGLLELGYSSDLELAIGAIAAASLSIGIGIATYFWRVR